MKRSIVIFLLSTFYFLLSTASAEEEPISKMRPLMGTFVEIKVYETEKSKAEKAIDEALSEIERIENLLSKYKETSEISKINREAGNAPAAVSAETLEVIKKSLEFSKKSEGAFDITVGPLMELWGFTKHGSESGVRSSEKRKSRLPSPEEIAQTLKRVGYEKLGLDEANKTVKLKVPGMEIDLGGIGKGYAADRAMEVLKNNGIRRAIADVGGNLCFLGAPERGYWVAGVKDPGNPKRLARTINVERGAVATSGGYENFVVIAGKKYCHIMDPRTGRPVPERKGVTITAPTAIEADALSTSAFILGKGWFERLRLGKGYDIIELE